MIQPLSLMNRIKKAEANFNSSSDVIVFSKEQQYALGQDDSTTSVSTTAENTRVKMYQVSVQPAVYPDCYDTYNYSYQDNMYTILATPLQIKTKDYKRSIQEIAKEHFVLIYKNSVINRNTKAGLNDSEVITSQIKTILSTDYFKNYPEIIRNYENDTEFMQHFNNAYYTGAESLVNIIFKLQKIKNGDRWVLFNKALINNLVPIEAYKLLFMAKFYSEGDFASKSVIFRETGTTLLHDFEHILPAHHEYYQDTLVKHTNFSDGYSDIKYFEPIKSIPNKNIIYSKKEKVASQDIYAKADNVPLYTSLTHKTKILPEGQFNVVFYNIKPITDNLEVLESKYYLAGITYSKYHNALNENTKYHEKVTYVTERLKDPTVWIHTAEDTQTEYSYYDMYCPKNFMTLTSLLNLPPNVTHTTILNNWKRMNYGVEYSVPHYSVSFSSFSKKHTNFIAGYTNFGYINNIRSKPFKNIVVLHGFSEETPIKVSALVCSSEDLTDVVKSNTPLTCKDIIILYNKSIGVDSNMGLADQHGETEYQLGESIKYYNCQVDKTSELVYQPSHPTNGIPSNLETTATAVSNVYGIDTSAEISFNIAGSLEDPKKFVLSGLNSNNGNILSSIANLSADSTRIVMSQPSAVNNEKQTLRYVRTNTAAYNSLPDIRGLYYKVNSVGEYIETQYTGNYALKSDNTSNKVIFSISEKKPELRTSKCMANDVSLSINHIYEDNNLEKFNITRSIEHSETSAGTSLLNTEGLFYHPKRNSTYIITVKNDNIAKNDNSIVEEYYTRNKVDGIINGSTDASGQVVVTPVNNTTLYDFGQKNFIIQTNTSAAKSLLDAKGLYYKINPNKDYVILVKSQDISLKADSSKKSKDFLADTNYKIISNGILSDSVSISINNVWQDNNIYKASQDYSYIHEETSAFKSLPDARGLYYKVEPNGDYMILVKKSDITVKSDISKKKVKTSLLDNKKDVSITFYPWTKQATQTLFIKNENIANFVEKFENSIYNYEYINIIKVEPITDWSQEKDISEDTAATIGFKDIEIQVNPNTYFSVKLDTPVGLRIAKVENLPNGIEYDMISDILSGYYVSSTPATIRFTLGNMPLNVIVKANAADRKLI